MRVFFLGLLFGGFIYNSIGCKEKSRKENNIFYIEYITESDSLLVALNHSTAGKAAYYDQNKEIQVVSLQYLTGEEKKVHFLKTIDELKAGKAAENNIKYEIKFNSRFINDSIAYAVRKFIYNNEKWNLKSDMGTIKVYDYISDFDRFLPIINSNVANRLIKTIAIDTYSY